MHLVCAQHETETESESRARDDDGHINTAMTTQLVEPTIS